MIVVVYRPLLILIALASLSACTKSPDLGSSYPAQASLATAILDGLANRDRAKLDAIAISEQEFRESVWPDLPAAKPERNLPMSYVWGDLHQKSSIALSDTLSRYGGKRFTLKSVTFSGETPYAHYRVHRDATFHVVDTAGTESSIRVCGSFIDKGGAWKVFSYVTE